MNICGVESTHHLAMPQIPSREVAGEEDTTKDTTTNNNVEIAAISWTGGKDCNLALHYAMRNPTLDVQYLICFRPEGNAFKAHPIQIMQAQADSIGLQLLFVDIPKDTTDYMKAYVDDITKLKDEYGIKVIATGDMDLVGTMERNWIERCCELVGDGMRAYLPLWQMDRIECLQTLIQEKFEIIFTCVKSPYFDGSWIGRMLDEEAMNEMQMIAYNYEKEGHDKPLDLGGERGEYHTMCINGPMYKERVAIDANAQPHREDRPMTEWKGNIHNASSIWYVNTTTATEPCK